MKGEKKNTITVGELVEQKYGKIPNINIPIVDMTSVQNAIRNIQPTLNKTRKIFEDFKEKQSGISIIPNFSDTNIIMENYKPTSVSILEEQRNIVDELRILNEHLSPRKKDKSTLFFNEKEKTITRDTETRSYTHKFTEGGMNFKLVKKLIEHDNFRQTRNIKTDIQSKSVDAVRKKILKINQEIAKKLRDKDLKLIVGESGSGYRINPNLKIYVIE